MKWWIKIGCFLTGWNHKILQECKEASFQHLRKYTSALIIMILLWGFTGYCFADGYIGTSLFGSCISALIFIVVVVQIERQIILMHGGKKTLATFRILLALIMSVVSSSILDQIIFKKDIEREKINQTTQMVDSLLPIRSNLITDKLIKTQRDIDSISRQNAILNEQIALRPMIKTTTYEYDFIKEDSTSRKRRELTGAKEFMTENPRIQQVANNDTLLNRLREQLNKCSDEKINLEDKLREEINENYGFLTELKIMIKIIKNDTVAMIFYIIIFAFLLGLELLIVISKLIETECDYELIVRHQLNTQIDLLKALKPSHD